MIKLFTIGCDEVGRGPLAGPVVSASVLSLDYEKDKELFKTLKITDSKKITEKKRQKILSELNISNLEINKPIKITETLYYSIIEVSPEKIDEINILQASLLSMKESIELLVDDPNKFHALIDGNKIPDGLKISAEWIIKGDLKEEIIGLASIIAKEYRDQLMKEYGKEYPGYGFEKHSGYPTKLHKEKIIELGVTKIHRKSFGGVKENL